ncbi:hypothetical protein BV898_05169 [Hypsibius exemplaris]|uniref:Uncharacterized protein n=1 Tax=Hypsibius exemplaris TaxID=2072580 RepID=A0A1W0X047_HYPEX|nr:hypothetical protein BV898_05169 [Hypsibius exemplaris]
MPSVSNTEIGESAGEKGHVDQGRPPLPTNQQHPSTSTVDKSNHQLLLVNESHSLRESSTVSGETVTPSGEPHDGPVLSAPVKVVPPPTVVPSIQWETIELPKQQGGIFLPNIIIRE